jgi:hypothetical protein
MMPVATVLYEDKMQVGSGGTFPPHDFILAMVAELTGTEVWNLRKLVDKNPRNGVSKLIGDLRFTSRLAAEGKLCIVVDRDRVAEQLGMPKRSAETEVTAKLLEKSDAPEKLSVHYLDPNMEGLLRSIEECEPTMPAPLTKDHNSRDIYLNRAAFSRNKSLFDCVKGKQPSIGALVGILANLCTEAVA